MAIGAKERKMRKIIASEYVTLDGTMEDPGGGEKTGYGGWSGPFWSDETAKFKYEELFAGGCLLLGRVTYQGFAAAWPTMEGTGDFGERMNSLPKYVVSTTLKTLPWNNSKQISQNVAQEIGKLKEQSGQDILVFGSGTLVQSLAQQNLIDEYRLMVHPIVVGGGKRLFHEGFAKSTLKLVDAKPFSSGIVLLTYQKAESH
jgi:dihydrofolate reductase